MDGWWWGIHHLLLPHQPYERQQNAVRPWELNEWFRAWKSRSWVKSIIRQNLSFFSLFLFPQHVYNRLHSFSYTTSQKSSERQMTQHGKLGMHIKWRCNLVVSHARNEWLFCITSAKKAITVDKGSGFTSIWFRFWLNIHWAFSSHCFAYCFRRKKDNLHFRTINMRRFVVRSEIHLTQLPVVQKCTIRQMTGLSALLYVKRVVHFTVLYPVTQCTSKQESGRGRDVLHLRKTGSIYSLVPSLSFHCFSELL